MVFCLVVCFYFGFFEKITKLSILNINGVPFVLGPKTHITKIRFKGQPRRTLRE